MWGAPAAGGHEENTGGLEEEDHPIPCEETGSSGEGSGTVEEEDHYHHHVTNRVLVGFGNATIRNPKARPTGRNLGRLSVTW